MPEPMLAEPFRSYLVGRPRSTIIGKVIGEMTEKRDFSAILVVFGHRVRYTEKTAGTILGLPYCAS